MAKTMYVEKSVVIDRDVQDVFEYVRFTKNQMNYSKWSMADPDQKIAELGEDGSVGHVFSWDSQMDNVGAGRQEIKNVIKDQEIHYEIKFERPMPSVAESFMKVDKLGDNQTKVTWSFESPMDDSMADKIEEFQQEIGIDIDESLSNLKSVLES